MSQESERALGQRPIIELPFDPRRVAIPERALTRAPSALVIFWILALVVGVAGNLLALDVDDSETAFALGSFTAILALAGVFIDGYRRSGNALSPLCLAMIVLFFLYPFHGLMTQDNGFLLTTLGSDAQVWQAKALLVMTLSVPFFAWGFYSRLGASIAGRLPRLGFIVDDAHASTRGKLLGIYLLAFAPRVGMLLTGQYFHWSAERQAAEIQFLLNVLATLPTFVTLWYLMLGLRHRHRAWLLIGLAMLGGEIIWGFISGSRIRMLDPVIAAIAAYSYLVRPVGLRRLALALVIFAMVALPFLTAFRFAYFEQVEAGRESVGVGTVVSALSEAATTDNDIDVVEGGGPFEAIANRFHGLTSLALVMRYTPERSEYRWGIPYLLIVPQAIVPRFFWPDKPEVGTFRETFRTLYWGLDPTSPTSIAVSLLGDLWVNLHLFGALFGSFFYAFFISFLYRHLRYGIANASMLPLLVFSIHLTDLLHSLEGTLDATIAGLMKSLFIYLVVAWVLDRRAGDAPGQGHDPDPRVRPPARAAR